MSKKYIFLSIFSKITIFACVFCTMSALADTTTCDIDFTPVTGNSWQNGTPTPTNPVAIESVGTKVGNKYQIPVVAQGKNLFDKNKENIAIGGFVSGTGGFSGEGNVVTDYTERKSMISVMYPIKGGKTYTITRANGEFRTFAAFRVLFTTGNPTVSENIVGSKLSTSTTITSLTVDVPENATYLVIYIMHSSDDTYTIQNRLDIMQIEEGSVATPYTPYSVPITTTVYLDEPLRKVGGYADVLDYKNGTITRNVGVKVLDGTENWLKGSSAVANNSYYIPLRDSVDYHNPMVCSHLLSTTDYPEPTERQGKAFIGHQTTYPLCCLGLTDKFADTTALQTWLASQYANGTPVTIYYPLATPVVEQIENWSCTPPITDIKIATTKMVEDEFAAAEAQLATTVQTIESVVSRTIAQTGQIQILQDTKQTRPDESCPANMKCLLVQDEDGTPHWYPIIEP